MCLYAVILLYVVADTNSISAVMSCQQLGLPLVVDNFLLKLELQTKHSVPQ